VAATAARPASALDNRAVQIPLVIALGAAWGLAFPSNRYAMIHGVPPLGYTAWVFVTAAAIGLAACAMMGARARMTRWFVLFTLFTGLFRCALPVAVMALAVRHIPAGLMVMISSTSAIMTYGAAIAFKRERFHPVRLGGVVAGLTGVGFILVPSSNLPDPADFPWVLFSFLAPVMFSVTTMTIDFKRPPGAHTMALTAAMFTWAAAVMVPAALLTGSFFLPSPPFHLYDGAMLLHGLINGVCFIWLFELIRVGGVVVASQVSYITPVAGVTWGVVLLGEHNSKWIWLALALIVLGLTLVNYRRRSGG
jgi:drug/metabolite transporter (DMT)-like permease